jgi:hypothetical protein
MVLWRQAVLELIWRATAFTASMDSKVAHRDVDTFHLRLSLLCRFHFVMKPFYSSLCVVGIDKFHHCRQVYIVEHPSEIQPP